MNRPLTKSAKEVAASFVEGQERAARIARRRAIPAIKPQKPRREVDRRPKHERLPISPDQIKQLHTDAVKRGDQFFARVCERALQGNQDALNSCKAALYGLD